MTKKITKLSPAVCKILRDQINKELSAPLKALGFDVHAGNAKYSDGTVTFSLKLTMEGYDEERVDFDNYCGMFGLTADDFGKEIHCGRDVLTLAGLKPSRPKYPILAAKGGEMFKLPEKAVAKLAGANEHASA